MKIVQGAIDPIVQSGTFDGGRSSVDRVAELLSAIPPNASGANLVDAALAQITKASIIRCQSPSRHRGW
jgi:hypothetical protein